VHEVESLLRKHAPPGSRASSSAHSSSDASASNSTGEHTQSASQFAAGCQSELSRKQSSDSVSKLQSELADELGDVLFNALLLVSICARDHANGLTLDECAVAACAKLRRRAPYVDGDRAPANVAEAQELWQAGKAKERREAQDTSSAESPTVACEQVQTVLAHGEPRAATPLQREALPPAPIGSAAPFSTMSNKDDAQREHAQSTQNEASVHERPRCEAPSLAQDAPESDADHRSLCVTNVKDATTGAVLVAHAADTNGAADSVSSLIEGSVGALDPADCSDSASDHGLSDWARAFAQEEPEPSDGDESE